MLKKIQFFWAILHYNLFKFEAFASRVMHIPFKKLLNRPSVVKYYSKRGIDNPSKLVLDTTINPQNGSSILLAGIQSGGILVILQFSVVFFILGILGEEALSQFFEGVVFYGLFFLIPAGIINNLLLFRKDRYLEDFAKFEQLPQSVITKYRILSITFIVFVVCFFFGSLFWAVGRP